MRNHKQRKTHHFIVCEHSIMPFYTAPIYLNAVIKLNRNNLRSKARTGQGAGMY